MQLLKTLIPVLLACAPLTGAASGQDGLPADYCRWEVVDYSIVEPLCGLTGDAQSIAVTDKRKLHNPNHATT